MKTYIHLLFAFYFLCSFISCRNDELQSSAEEITRQDSLALHIAVIPVMDCLPIYYAERMGIFRRMGLSVRLHEYLSQMDCDTALLKSRCQLAYSDIARVIELQTDTLPLYILFGTGGQLKLITAHSKRIHKLRNLKERMIAVNRLSMADYWSDDIMKEAGLDQADTYRPQINDLRLRTSMLTEQLLDAAFLPEPYATQARLQGNPCLFTTPDTIPFQTGMALLEKTLEDSLRKSQIRLFVQTYNAAVEALNAKEHPDTLRKIFIQQYAMSATIADSIQIPLFRKASQPRQSEIDKITLWLKERERKVSSRSPLHSTRFNLSE